VDMYAIRYVIRQVCQRAGIFLENSIRGDKSGFPKIEGGRGGGPVILSLASGKVLQLNFGNRILLLRSYMHIASAALVIGHCSGLDI
jgi:hypothetical protein